MAKPPDSTLSGLFLISCRVGPTKYSRRKASIPRRFRPCARPTRKIAASMPPPRSHPQMRGVEPAPALTPDQAVDRLIIAGTAAQCRDRLAELFKLAAQHSFN